MEYRDYKAEDYQEVKLLVESHEYDWLPEKLGGVGIVAEDEGEIVGFVWAGDVRNSDYAIVDYFVVKKDRRDKGEAGPTLMLHLFMKLTMMGIKRVSGVLIAGTGYDVSLCQVYKDVGMDVRAASYYVSGNAKVILDGIRGRYYGKQHNHNQD